jgi:hypothetical protein
MDPKRIELIQRHEDKASLMETGMRDRQTRFIDHTLTIEENVQIHRAGSGSTVIIPSEGTLDLLERREETLRGNVGFKLHHPIEKPLLARIGPVTNRFRLIEQ